MSTLLPVPGASTVYAPADWATMRPTCRPPSEIRVMTARGTGAHSEPMTSPLTATPAEDRTAAGSAL